MAEGSVTYFGRARRALARFFAWLAVPWAVLAFIALVLDDVHFSVFGFEMHAGKIKNPVWFFVGWLVLAKLVAPELPFAATPIGRAWARMRKGWERLRGPRGTPRARVALVALLALIGTIVVLRVRVRLYVAEAERLVALADNDGAAACYGRAAAGLTLNHADYVSRQGYAYFRGGRFQEGVDVLGPRFAKKQILIRKGYQGLWKCYGGLERWDEACDVVRAAMSRFPEIGEECTGTLLAYERKRLERPGAQIPVHVTFAAPAQSPAAAADALWIAGNWSRHGHPSEIHGWEPVPMQRAKQPDGSVQWTAEIGVAPSQELPYTVLGLPSEAPFAAPALAAALFWVPTEYLGQVPPPRLDVELEVVPDPHGVPPVVRRSTEGDGRPRVLALWPDCGSWFLLNLYAHMGYLPNAARLVHDGTRFEMISTNPPFTSTAYVQMVELQPGSARPPERSLLDVALIQLKGLPFLDGLVPAGVLAGEERETIFTVLGRRSHSAVNLVFGDKYVSSAEDGASGEGAALDLDEAAFDTERDVPEEARADLLRDVLRIDVEQEPERAARLRDHGLFFYGLKNTEAKAGAGLDVWREMSPDFLLLRFPAVDLMSHRFFDMVEKDPTANPLMEVYRHLDRVLGDFTAQLDGDDTLILVSDHGIYGTLHHHPSCVLIVEGPGLPAGHAFGTIPIGHFPSVVLSRFGVRDGSERLSSEELQLLYPGD